jgi:hypothetical protein
MVRRPKASSARRAIRLEIAAIDIEKSQYVRAGSRELLALRHRGGVGERNYCVGYGSIRANEWPDGAADIWTCARGAGPRFAWTGDHVSLAVSATVQLSSERRAAVRPIRSCRSGRSRGA